MTRAVGGVARVRVDGKLLRVVGSYTYGLGIPKREAVVGTEPYGFTEMPQTPYLEGEVVDGPDFDLSALAAMTDGSVVCSLVTGKDFILSNAYFASEGTGETESGKIKVRFEGSKAKLVPRG